MGWFEVIKVIKIPGLCSRVEYVLANTNVRYAHY